MVRTFKRKTNQFIYCLTDLLFVLFSEIVALFGYFAYFGYLCLLLLYFVISVYLLLFCLFSISFASALPFCSPCRVSLKSQNSLNACYFTNGQKVYSNRFADEQTQIVLNKARQTQAQNFYVLFLIVLTLYEQDLLRMCLIIRLFCCLSYELSISQPLDSLSLLYHLNGEHIMKKN